MIQTLSKHITQYMFNRGEGIESFEVHQYGIEVILSTLINILFVLIIGLISERMMDGFLYCIGFYAIRKFSGGYHCSTYARCIGLHVSMFIIYIFTYTYYVRMSVYIYLATLVIFIVYAPIKNRDLTDEQAKRYKVISCIILMIYIMLANLTPYTSIFTYVIMIVSILMLVCVHNNEKYIT